MRLLNFQIKKYRSIDDTGIVKLSEFDNISVLAGQNESGKSAILKALSDFARGEFEPDSVPFSTEEPPDQIVSCTYSINESDDLADILAPIVKKEYDLQEEAEKVLDERSLNKLKQFTITRIKESDKIITSIDEETFNIFRGSVLDKPVQPVVGEEAKEKEKYLDVADTENERVAGLFWQITPRIIFFDDFCDLLPDKIFLYDLKNVKKDVKGYHAVRNFEKIVGAEFISKDTDSDSVRGAKQKKENDRLSASFQKDWGQRIHGESEVVVSYEFQKRDGVAENGSYINFCVETKEGQLLPLKQRSKGLVWFLSLWLELTAQDTEQNNFILLLDEPDQHLHISAQNDILKLINKLASKEKKKEGNQIIYATHSPYLIESDYLSRIKLIINTEKQGTRIEGITTNKIAAKYKKDALQPIAAAIGLSVGAFSTLQKKNVILEGISDFHYFSAMKKILDRDGDYCFVPGVGISQINNLISLSIGYGLEWIAIIDDDDSAKGGKGSKKKFDEIKDFVFGGNEEETKEKVYTLPGIAGIENMFALDDLKLVNATVGKGADMVKVVGQKRKVFFSKSFFEKVDSKDITAGELSQTAKDNFGKAFNFIDKNFVQPSQKIGNV